MIRKISKLVLIIISVSAVSSLLYKIINQDKIFLRKIYPNVYIDNNAVGGKTRKEIISSFSKKNKQLSAIKLNINYQGKNITVFTGNQLKLAYDGEATAERAFLIGRSSHLPSKITQRLNVLFNWQRYDFTSQITFDRGPVQEFLDMAEQKYNRPAKNALFQFAGGKVTSFRKEERGTAILIPEFLQDLDRIIQTLKNNPKTQTLTLRSQPVEPEITLAKSNNYGIEEFLAEGKSDYSHSIPNRIHNIILAASKFNGVLIPEDKVFSFNEIVGDISSTTGYQPAYIIKAGKTVLGDGGGVCQVSTTLFRAALNTGLPIIQRVAHAYRVGYYENDSKPGLDATVFAPSVDLKIKNDTPAYLLIETEIDVTNNQLIFKFYGKKDNRRVEIGTPVLYDVSSPPPDLYQDDPTLKKGVVRQTDFAAWGGKANFTYKVYKDGKLSVDTNFFSSYKPWQAVYLRGTAD